MRTRKSYRIKEFETVNVYISEWIYKGICGYSGCTREWKTEASNLARGSLPGGFGNLHNIASTEDNL